MSQKVQFLTEQIEEEKKQAKMREQQYNKIVEALKKTAEENASKKNNLQGLQAIDKPMDMFPSQKDWKDTLDELNQKKEEVNNLQERVLQFELKIEKLNLDHKIALQAKDDIIGEEKLRYRHKESDLRQAAA